MRFLTEREFEMRLKEGEVYCMDDIELTGWSIAGVSLADDDRFEGYSLWEYFDSREPYVLGRYKGPDKYGVEPTVDVVRQHPVGCSCGSPDCPEWIDSQEVCE